VKDKQQIGQPFYNSVTKGNLESIRKIWLQNGCPIFKHLALGIFFPIQRNNIEPQVFPVLTDSQFPSKPLE
jgi:hypothetical protein